MGSGRCSAIQAMPGTIKASATVSQPFSRAKVSASASAATVPVAYSRAGGGDARARIAFAQLSVAKPLSAASSSASPAKGIERSKPAIRQYSAIRISERRRDTRGRPQDRNVWRRRAALCEEARGAKQHGKAKAERNMRAEPGAPRLRRGFAGRARARHQNARPRRRMPSGR